MMKYVIYQLKNFGETEYAFRSWDYAEQNGFGIQDYEVVYEGEISEEDSLDALFIIFNAKRPADFRGHSLSVSDVVSLTKDGDTKVHYYYCDSIGWEDITEKMNH